MLPGLGKQGTGDREGGGQQGPCTELSLVQGRGTRGGWRPGDRGWWLGTGVMCVLHRSVWLWGQGNEGRGRRGRILGGHSQGLHGALGAGTGVVIMEMEGEDRSGLCWGSWGVRGEAGRKTPTFCKIAVCCLGVLKEPLEKSLRGALRRVSKAWTHCTQWGARFLRSAAWSRPVHSGSRQVPTVPDGPREQVVSPPSCSHNRDPKGSFGRGWSAGGGFPRGRTSYLMEPTLLPAGTTTNTTCPPTESQAAGERGSGTGSAPEGGMCPHCWATPPL